MYTYILKELRGIERNGKGSGASKAVEPTISKQLFQEDFTLPTV